MGRQINPTYELWCRQKKQMVRSINLAPFVLIGSTQNIVINNKQRQKEPSCRGAILLGAISIKSCFYSYRRGVLLPLLS
jgi:hypothetical protein